MDELTLNKSGLGALKNIAHELGVPGSKSHTKYTKKNKDELIQQILKFQKMREPQTKSKDSDDNEGTKRKLQKPPEDETNNQICMVLLVAGAIITITSLYNQQKPTVVDEKQVELRPVVVEQSHSEPEAAQGPGIYSF